MVEVENNDPSFEENQIEVDAEEGHTLSQPPSFLDDKAAPNMNLQVLQSHMKNCSLNTSQPSQSEADKYHNS